MRQIGSRQEASRLGGIGSCGRELCCSTWLTDFRSVSTSAARYQQLSLNPQKLAGQCGKLKCCLNYELDMYLDAMKSFPKADVKLHTEKGTATHIKTDVFKRQMWFGYSGEAAIGTGLIALSPERVQDIIKMNKEGQKPKDLKEFGDVKEPVVSDYENVVGQDSLNRFEHVFKKKKRKKKRRPEGSAQTAGQPQQRQSKPQQKPQAQQGKKQDPNAKKQNDQGAEGQRPKRRRPNRRRPNNNNNSDNQNKGGNEG